MALHPLQTHQRQVHLDFHTSPHIPDVASEFDARAFAQTMKDASVNSVTVFAKCHHGMCYYPTKTGTQHPALGGRDLLGEQIEALHSAGIRAPIYTTVAWEEDVAQRFPQWRQMTYHGNFARCGNPDPTLGGQPGGWWYNNFVHPDYQDYIEAHVREIFANYEVDGIFFDIVFFDHQSCWSESSAKFRADRGLLGRDLATQVKFESAAQIAFASRFTRLVSGLDPSATIFYNSPNPIYTDSKLGVHTRHDLQTHWELESLPSGFWGYQHFPRLARAFGRWGKPYLGMTGRFQRMWGDFGGLKPQAALEFECFRTQAMGGANSVGDQLPPRGTLDAGAYDLIGSVFAQCAAVEAFYDGSTTLSEIGIIAPGAAGLDAGATDKTLEGAVLMCEEAHYECAVLDEASSLTEFKLLILPDSVEVTPRLADSLRAYLAAGGKLVLSGRSGFDGDGASLLGLPLQVKGTVDKYPSFWRSLPEFSTALSRSDRVVYMPGLNVEAGAGTRTLVQRVLPYFKRNDLHFCSHFQTPPQAESSEFAAVIAGENFVYFADPIFQEYRQSGNIAVRDGWRIAVNDLIGAPLAGAGLPSTVLSAPRRRGDDLILTLLHYIPTRKALDIDMIEERSSFGGELLRLPAVAESVRDFETGESLPRHDGRFVLPLKKGRLLLEVPGFFAA